MVMLKCKPKSGDRKTRHTPETGADWPGIKPWKVAIHELRDRLGLNQTQAGERLAVSQNLWSAWERGTRVPTSSHQILLRLLNAGKI